MAAIFLGAVFAFAGWLLAEAGFRPGGRVPFCARQKGTFTLAWGGTHIAQQCEWRPKSASATLSGGTHYAPAALRSNSRRKSDFYCEGRDAYARRWCCAICEELIFLTTATVSLLLSLRVYTDLRDKNMHPACCLNLVTPLLPVPRRTEHRVGRCAAGRICIVIKLAAAV